MSPAEVSVVIPALNEATGIVRAIQCVNDAGQIIVVDGGSTDDTTAIASSFHQVTVIQSPAGRGTQLRLGADVAKRPVLLFLHADCHLANGTLERIVAAIDAGHRWGAVTQKIADSSWCFRCLELGNNARVRFFGLPFGDQAMFVTRELYEQVGGFDNVPLMEDLMLSKRLRTQSWPVLVRGPITISARRWQRRGVVKQTLLNWKLQLLLSRGHHPDDLAERYRR